MEVQLQLQGSGKRAMLTFCAGYAHELQAFCGGYTLGLACPARSYSLAVSRCYNAKFGQGVKCNALGGFDLALASLCTAPSADLSAETS